MLFLQAIVTSMAFTGKLETEEEIKSSPQKFWGAINDNTDLLGKILPEVFKSIEVIEGDGKSVGSIRHIKYAEGETQKKFFFFKQSYTYKYLL